MTFDMEPKRLSPVNDRHQELNARFANQADWQIPEVYTTAAEENTVLHDSVGLAEITTKGKLMIKGSKAEGIVTASFGTSPIQPGDVLEVKSSQLLIAKSTLDEYLVLTLPGAEREIANSLEAEIASQNTFVSIIDQTSGLVGLLIAGPKSIRIMQKLCAISFIPSEFPNLHVAQSSFAKVRATIIRHDQGNLPSFELYADRSYAGYLWDTILDAGKEFDIRPVGWEAIENPRR